MKAEFEDAGLRVLEIIAVRRWMSDKWVVLAESGHVDPESLKVKLKGSQYEGLEVTEKLGEGKRSVVYRARWRGRDVGVKVYKPAAIARHARKHKLPLAEFEHRRNKAFFEARGMAKYVAEPLGFVVEPGFQMSLQECLDGEVYYFAQREHATFISPRFMDDLAELVIAQPRGQALRHRPARHERHGGPPGRRPEAVRLQPDSVHGAATEPVHRAGAQAGVVRQAVRATCASWRASTTSTGWSASSSSSTRGRDFDRRPERTQRRPAAGRCPRA